MKNYTLLFEIVKFILIILFIYTGTSKLIGHEVFLKQLSKVPLLEKYAMINSIAIPAAEIICALLFVIPKTMITAWWIASIMLTMFTIYIALMMSFAPRLPCSCGGIISALSWRQHLAVNIILSILGWIRLYRYYFIQKFSMHTRE